MFGFESPPYNKDDRMKIYKQDRLETKLDQDSDPNHR